MNAVLSRALEREAPTSDAEKQQVGEDVTNGIIKFTYPFAKNPEDGGVVVDILFPYHEYDFEGLRTGVEENNRTSPQLVPLNILIQMKEAADGPQDKADIEELKKIKEKEEPREQNIN